MPQAIEQCQGHPQAAQGSEEEHRPLHPGVVGHQAQRHAADGGGAGEEEGVEAHDAPAHLRGREQLQAGVGGGGEGDARQPHADQHRQRRAIPARQPQQGQQGAEGRRPCQQLPLPRPLAVGHHQRRRDGPHPHSGVHEPELLGAHVQHLPRQQGQHGAVVVAEGAQEGHDDDHLEDGRRAEGVGQPLAQFSQHGGAGPARRRIHLLVAYEQQTHQHRPEGGGVQQEGALQTDGGDGQPRHRRP